jgi:hypothetical protein
LLERVVAFFRDYATTQKTGYVYEVEVSNPMKGHRGQYAYKKELKPTKKTKVYPKDYAKYIVRVKSKDKLMELLRAKSKPKIC